MIWDSVYKFADYGFAITMFLMWGTAIVYLLHACLSCTAVTMVFLISLSFFWQCLMVFATAAENYANKKNILSYRTG